mmetsp:Transcript_84649/g.140109  ORF Transcript_84649/g.140109 Transcript_84649/m.140109 type:complete len:177 (-) Transcript_84649:8-538(-)
MAKERTSLDLTQGITPYSSRLSLKMLFAQFGEVASCWIPHVDHRGKDNAYVRFETTAAAQRALDAAGTGQLFLDGVAVKAEWREASARMHDSRDFDAKGSNLQTSRDLFQAARERDEEKGRDKKSKKKRSRSRKKKRRRSSSSSEERWPPPPVLPPRPRVLEIHDPRDGPINVDSD